LGGGSVIDAAKAVACLVNSEVGDLSPYMDREVAFSAKRLPLLALPMTAGTGAEVTPFSVLTSEATGVKKSLPSPFFYPDVAVVVPSYLTTVPQKVVGDVGLDALAHAYEALWSVNANPVSDALGSRAIKLITDNFLAHYADTRNANAASAMSAGATIAGMAFSNTLTAGCHALSYPIGNLFGLSHGASCAMTLHLIAEFNRDAVGTKFADLSAYLGLAGPSDIPRSIARLRETVTTIPTLRELEATPADLKAIAAGAFQPLLRNNPVPLTETAILRLLMPEIS
jgi:alcohol dehydrogenase class IV